MQGSKGFVVVHLQSDSVSSVYATYAEADAARIQQVEDHLANDAGYLLELLESEACLSSAHQDHDYLEALKRNPEAAQDIARQRGLDVLLVSPVEDEEDEE